MAIDYHGALKADGVVGFDAFAGKVVEIDYGRRALVIHHDRPSTAGYRAVPMIWRGQQSLFPLRITTPALSREVVALLDTGSKWSLTLTNRDPLARDSRGLPRLGTRTGSKSDGTRLALDVLALPALSIGGMKLTDVQADVERAGRPSALAHSIAGNDLLKRFDILIDYRTSDLFFKANGLADAPYNALFPWRTVLAGIAAVPALAGLFVILRRRRKRSLRIG